MEKQYITELKYGDYSARIDLGRGANCISLRNRNYQAALLREPDLSKEPDNPYLYGMPILFPVNRIQGGKFEFEGREYCFPLNEPSTGCHLHGELHQARFQVLRKSKSRMLCSYRADSKEQYLMFPHEFEIRMEYELKEDGFYHTTEVRNLSDTNMPVFLGFHTTFQLLFTRRSRPQDICVLTEISKEYERNQSTYLPTGKLLEFDKTSLALCAGEFRPYGNPISRHYRSRNPGRMVIYDAGNHLSLVYENDEKFGFRLVYNGNAEEYICLEPQNCMANCQNAPFDRAETGFDYIEPGKSKIYRSRIRIEEGDKR